MSEAQTEEKKDRAVLVGLNAYCLPEDDNASDETLAEQLRPGGDDDVPQFLFFHGYPSNRFKIAKFSLLAAYSFRKTRKFRS